MQLAVGTVLHKGTYKIESVLGQGSFGITYLATNLRNHQRVAIKEFYMKELNSRNNDGSISGMTQGSLSYNYGQKFKKEAQNLANLKHPNIVRVNESFEDNGTFYYAMEYIEGVNLNDYIEKNATSQKDALNIIKAVADALVYMHDEKHLLHLDLKPGNIMRRTKDGHVFLIDFGLSKHFSDTGQPETSTTIGLGTAGYAPLEQSNQANSGEFRPTIDVYALGATLYKLLIRQAPPNSYEVFCNPKIIEEKLQENGVKGKLAKAVICAMHPHVQKRTQTVREFVEALPKSATKKPTHSQEAQNDEETEIITGIRSTSNMCIDEETVLISNIKTEVRQPNVQRQNSSLSSTTTSQTSSSSQNSNAFYSELPAWAEVALAIIGGIFFIGLFIGLFMS